MKLAPSMINVGDRRREDYGDIDALAAMRAWERSQPQLLLQLDDLPEATTTAASETAPLNGPDGRPPAEPPTTEKG